MVVEEAVGVVAEARVVPQPFVAFRSASLHRVSIGGFTPNNTWRKAINSAFPPLLPSSLLLSFSPLHHQLGHPPPPFSLFPPSLSFLPGRSSGGMRG